MILIPQDCIIERAMPNIPEMVSASKSISVISNVVDVDPHSLLLSTTKLNYRGATFGATQENQFYVHTSRFICTSGQFLAY